MLEREREAKRVERMKGGREEEEEVELDAESVGRRGRERVHRVESIVSQEVERAV